MDDDRQNLLRVVRTVRNRWRLRVALRGLAVVILVAAALVLGAGYAIDASRFDPAAVNAVRWLAYLALVAVAWRFLVRPLRRRVGDERVALYLEEHEPSLNGRLLAAVELGREGSGSLSPALFERLVRSAVEECRRVDDGRRVERHPLRRFSGFLAGSGAFCVALFLAGPAFLDHTTPLLLRPWESSGARNPYAILVEPGDALIARGADLKVVARLQGFDAADVELVVRSGGEEWRRWSMLREDEASLHTLMVFDLQEAMEYFVESGGVRSPVYRIEVVELPYVEEIDLVYRFPAYTGLDPVEQLDSGDVAALVGTEVALTIEPTIPVPGGAVELGSGGILPLDLGEDGKLRGSLRVGEPDRYRVLLDGAQGRRPASPDYVIDPFDDQPPMLRVARPGRDLRVTSLEEVTAEVKAQDDYGVQRLELVTSVNGGYEEAAALYEGRPGRRDFLGMHTFYLEEWELRPGDLVSYFARARDGSGGETVSDLYFLEVRPFDRDYRQADQGGMPGQGGRNGAELAEQERLIVAATFKVLRDRERSGEKAFLGDLATVALSQGRLREQVEQIVEKLKAHAFPDGSPFATMAELLPQAAEEMGVAEERLGENRPDLALGPEQKALQHLQRVDALFRDVEVARGQGGGGARGSIHDELTDLFELEMDRFKNQYEQVQRGDLQKTDEKIDETLEKLRELARRQQQENERMRARSRQAGGQQAGSSGDSQRQLAREAEEVARRLERLAREESMPELAEAARRLREAAEEMRRAASKRGGEALGATALEQLRQARRELESNRSGRLERDAQRVLVTTRRLRRQQESMVGRVERLEDGGAERDSALREIFEAKERMGSEVEALERDLEETSREAARDQPEASRRLQEAARGIRDDKVRDKILYSRGIVQQRSKDYALNFEEHIAETLAQLEERLEGAAGAIGESRDERLGRALEETREVVTALESVEERLRAGAEGDGNGRIRPRDLRQLGRELQERRLQLERLQEELRREEVDPTQLERILGSLRGLGAGDKLADPEVAAVLERDVVQGLKEFEYNLRRSLSSGEDERLMQVSDEDVPAGYEEMVDRYYKALAEGNR